MANDLDYCLDVGKNKRKRRLSGWSFPARTTARFLVVASALIGGLALVGLREIQTINRDNTEIRVDRAARAAEALFFQSRTDFAVDGDPGGSPQEIKIDSIDRLEPDDSFDSLVDSISEVNQGAANIFRLDSQTGSFDRIATSFTDQNGARVGGSQVEPGLIVEGHPAYEALIQGRRYIGEVPVAGRTRYAYLTPIVDADSAVVGILAVDVGWVDDLNRVNKLIAARISAAVVVALGAMAIAGVIVMFFAFRPMNRLIKVAHDLGSDDGPDSIQLTERRDEIGYLAQGLAKVAVLQRDLEQRAYNDPLTGIPNRGAFVRELERRFSYLSEGADAKAHEFAVLIIDLDGFKQVNDGLGHQAGDELLVSVARSLKAVLDPGEFIARLGGDEFALLTAPGVADVMSVQCSADRAIFSVSGVRQTRAGDTSMTASIGIALIPKHGITSSIALRSADLALYEVKRNGRGHSQIYQTGLSSPTRRRVHLTNELRQAVKANIVRLDYQPIIDTRNGRVRSVEALARWTHEVEGEIPPLEFVRVAENAGLIVELGNYVIEQACAQIAIWRKNGFQAPTIAVNVSPMQLWQSDFTDLVRESMDRHGVSPSGLCLELTESVLIQPEHARHRNLLGGLVELGVNLSIDDFGTGYSSLSYLHDLPVGQVKIDRMFLDRASKDQKRADLFAGIVSLAHNLGLSVVAEGVETSAELALAQLHGADFVQGFYLARPQPSDVVCGRFDTVDPHWPDPESEPLPT
ncbi:MAG: diguanylate cyclase (GGDEF)-like protein [Ilumatobacter sp.]|jgi:diguanylate cyclase (GGDEF)-like protein